tara:strand:- start:181 stop:468 length:288 start_codon:yes stop_codon:yes gene_type:complete
LTYKAATESDTMKDEDYYEQILCEVLDVLEGGDIALDFEEMPAAATTIRIIAKIAGDALTGVRATKELLDKLNRALMPAATYVGIDNDEERVDNK